MLAWVLIELTKVERAFENCRFVTIINLSIRINKDKEEKQKNKTTKQ